MKEQSKKRSPSPVMVSIVALIVLLTSTLAWFVMDQDEVIGAYDFMISSFRKPNADVYFMDGQDKKPADDYKNEDGTYNIDFQDPSAINYIGNLRVDAWLAGMGDFFVRVKMMHQFLQEDASGTSDVVHQYDNEMPYIIDSPYLNTDVGNLRKWYDNRKDDYSFYLASPVYTDNNFAYVTVPLITGFDSSKFDELVFSGTSLKVSIKIEAIQVERYPQFWNLTELPWPGASSRTSINILSTSS